MDGIHIHRTKSNDGCGYDSGKKYADDWFSFLNINNRISKQNNVCTAHIALYVRIFQQFNSNAIQMAYRIFLLDLFFKRLFSNMHNPISRIRIPI